MAKDANNSVPTRKYVGDFVMNITGINRDKSGNEDRLFISVSERPSSLHKGLELSDMAPRFGTGGSFPVGENFILAHAADHNTSPEFIMSVLNSTVGNKLYLQVEERAVGQKFINANGVEDTFTGRVGANMKEGEIYHVPVNLMLELGEEALNTIRDLQRSIEVERAIRNIRPARFVPKRKVQNFGGNSGGNSGDPKGDPKEQMKGAIG